MEQCLVSGSHGFLGKHLVAALEQRQFEIIRLSRDWKEIPEVDYIFHLAAYGNRYNQQDEDEIIRVNLMQTLDLFMTTKNMPYKKFVYVSTSSITLPVQTLYSASKLACEALIRAYDKPIVIVRPYSVTGVGEQEEHLIPTLIRAAYSGEEVPFVPEPVHDFIDVEDVVEAMIEIVWKDLFFYCGGDTIYDLGSGQNYSNRQVLELVEKITNKKVKTKIVAPMRNYDNLEWKSPQNWSHKSLEQSIKEMVEDYLNG